MAETKYYDADEAVRMLPLIKAYCRDIRDGYDTAEKLIAEHKRLASMTTLAKDRKREIESRKEEIRSQLESVKRRYDRWKNELGEMFITVCSTRLGRVDVPVFCDSIMSAVHFCVTPESTEDDIEWHQIGESCEKSKPYFTSVL